MTRDLKLYKNAEDIKCQILWNIISWIYYVDIYKDSILYWSEWKQYNFDLIQFTFCFKLIFAAF